MGGSEEQREAETALLEEVKRTAHVLSGLLQSATHLHPLLEPGALARLRAAVDKLEARAPTAEMVVALVGEAGASRRSLLNGVLGEPLLGVAATRRQHLTTVRRRPDFDYRVRYADGRVVEFGLSLPDRSALFAKSLAHAAEEAAAESAALEQAKLRVAEARTELQAREAAAKHEEEELVQATEAAKVAREGLPAAEDLRRKQDALVRSASLPQVLMQAPPWWAVWLWIVRLVLWPFWREPLRLQALREAEARKARAAADAGAKATASGEERCRAVEEQARAARARVEEQKGVLAERERDVSGKVVEQAQERVTRLRAERDKYAAERKATYLADVRAFDEGNAAEKAPPNEVVIDYPAEGIPVGVALMDTPNLTPEVDRVAEELWNTVRRDADALVVVRDGERMVSEELVEVLRRNVPLVLDTRAERAEKSLRRLFARIEGQRGLIRGVHAAMRLRRCVAELSLAQTAAEGAHRERLAALEAQRIVDPAEFRERQMKRAEGAIQQATDDVFQSATETVRAGVATLRAEQKAAVQAATERSAVEATIATINKSAPVRITELLERTSEHIARELHDVTETLETWALEEIHARYQIARRLGAEIFSPVASDVTREDLEGELHGVQPLAGAMDAFEKGRVGIGLGGAAAGAVIGTLILPGIGTAVGAFLGVFAGFVKGVDSLKKECIETLDARMNEIERQALSQLAARKPDLSRAIRMSLDEALEQALVHLNASIARLMEIERKAISLEQARLADIDSVRTVLEERDGRLAKLIESASAELLERAP